MLALWGAGLWGLAQMPNVLLTGITPLWGLAPLAGLLIGYALALWAAKDHGSDALLLRALILGGILAGLLVGWIALRGTENAAQAQRSAQIHAGELNRERALDRIRAARAAERARQIARFQGTRYIAHVDSVPLAELTQIADLDERFQAALRTLSDDYAALLERVRLGGVGDWVTATERAALEAQRAAHSEVYAAARVLADAVTTFSARYNSALEELQLSEAAQRVAVAELRRVETQFEHQQILALRQLDVQLMEAAIGGLNILIEDWGRWRYSADANQVQFDNPATERAFAEVLREFRRIREALPPKEGAGPADNPPAQGN